MGYGLMDCDWAFFGVRGILCHFNRLLKKNLATFVRVVPSCVQHLCPHYDLLLLGISEMVCISLHLLSCSFIDLHAFGFCVSVKLYKWG